MINKTINNMNKLLSICIPTYNRSKYLDQCLSKLIIEINILNIPIYISDNNSIDDTLIIVNKHKELYKYIFYFKQKNNVSIDENMLNVVKLSETKFSWLLGDDDIPKLNAFSDIISILKTKKSLELLVLNCTFVSDDLTQTFNHLMVLDNNLSYNNCIDFFNQHYNHTPYGNIIVNTKMFQENISEKYLGTSHAYSGTILEYLYNNYKKTFKNNIEVTSQPYVFLRCGVKSWTDYSDKVHFNDIPLWYEKLPKVYLNQTRAFRQYLKLQNKIFYLILLKENNKLNTMLDSKLFENFNIIQKMKVYFIVYCVPHKLTSVLRKIKDYIKQYLQK